MKELKKRYERFYAPKDLMVLRGTRGLPKKGSRLILADIHGYAEVYYMLDKEAINQNSLYIENLEVKSHERRKGYGRRLYHKIEQLAQNIGAEWIQIDSEPDAVNFWKKLGFMKTHKEFYGKKVNMIKKIDQ